MNNQINNFEGSEPDQYSPDIPTVSVDTGIETFNNRLLTTKKALIDYILMLLGYPLITVELTSDQFDCCISNACHTYTKYATFPERYLCVDLAGYTPEGGLNLKRFNISAVKDINLVPPMGFGTSTSELAFGMAGYISQQSNWSNFSFVSLAALHEFRDLAERMLYPKPDWTFNNVTGNLLMYPSPINAFNRNSGKYMVGGNNNQCQIPAVITVEIEPPMEELFSNDAVKMLTFGYAKMILGTVRAKFSNVSLPGGATISGEDMRREGQEAVDKGIDMIKAHESFGNQFIIC